MNSALDLPIQFVDEDDFEHLRPVFEGIVRTDGYGFRRSRKGVYVNPARARDWRMFIAGYKAALKEKS